MSNGRVEKKNSLLLEINNIKYQAKMERFGELIYTIVVDRDKPVNSEFGINS